MKKPHLSYTRFLFLAAVICCGVSMYAQQPIRCYFKFYNTSHGLPSSEINALAKDRDGFLWVGTSGGLSQYDGYTFHNYSYSKNKELLGSVNVIKSDSSSRLWIGTGTGLFCLVKNEIIKLSAEDILPQGINDILTVTDDEFWLATENGPVKLEINKIDFTGNKKIIIASNVLPQWNFKNASIDKRRATIVSKAADGTLYIAGETSLYRFLNGQLECLHTAATNRDKISSIFPVNKSTVYFDGDSTEINKIQNGVITKHNPLMLYKNNDSPSSATWYVGTRGAFCFDSGNGTVSSFISLYDSDIGWARRILKDGSLFWIASTDGLIAAKPYMFNRFEVEKEFDFKDYYSVFQLKSGRLLMGANFGRLFEKKENIFKLAQANVAPSAEIKALYEDENGWLWIATGYQGLVLIRNNKILRYTVAEGLHDNSLAGFIKTTNGKLYALGEHGITEIRAATDKTVSFKKYYLAANISKYAKFSSAIEAPDGSIWMGGEEGIMYLKDDSLHRFVLNDRQLVINYLIKDKNEAVWLAVSGEGILKCVFNKKNQLEIVKQFSEPDGLNTIHYLTLLVDNENNIWAGSSKGISVIRQGKNEARILNFDESDGFIKPGYSYMRMCQDEADEVWAVTTRGFTSFRPKQLLAAYTTPLVYITAVKELKSRQSVRNFDSMSHFDYNHNSFNFSFSALDYANQQGIRYFYKLSGVDTGWVNAGSLQSVNYENLSPGRFTFFVKALNNKGKWSEKEAAWSFSIVAPFWQKSWFLLLLIIGIGLLVFLVIKASIKAVKKREAEKTALQQLKAAGYREQLEVEQVINHFATSLNSISSIDDMLWDVAQNCISKLNFEDCVIYLKDQERNVLLQKAAWGPKTTAENKIVNPIEIPVGKGIVGSVAATGKAEIISDTANDDRYIVDDANRQSEITVPIMYNGKLLGIIDSEHFGRNFYTQRHLQILTTIASLCGGKIDTMNAERQAREKEIEVHKLKTSSYQYQLEVERIVSFFATAISSHYSVDDMLWDVAKNLIGKLGFEDCMIYMWNKDKTMLLQKAGFGTKGSMQSTDDLNIYHVPKGKGIVGAAVESKSGILANDTSLDKRYYTADEKIRLSELCVPVIHDNEVMGAINTEHTERNFYTERHLHILNTIASMLAHKIHMIEVQGQTREKEMQLLKLSKDLATSQLTALRMQMNPHFIFNSLNSVQHFILEGNVVEANKYLSKFSKLQRDILQCSSQQFITLEKEIEILSSYLQLEQFRFGDSFNYKISMNGEIEPSEIKIPPMMLQPFVENAIWHGLMALDSQRNLDIHFDLYSDDVLMAIIRDNGIGRNASAKLRQQDIKTHESKGMSIVQQRLQLLQQQYEQTFDVAITDITDANGLVKGTQVTLKIFIGDKNHEQH